MTSTLKRETLPDDPIVQFGRWFQEAQAADDPYPHAMSLATASTTGEASSRIVLLRRFDQDGFVFFSATNTLAARQMAANPRVSLLFAWLLMERQVKVLGTAVKLPAAQSWRYFAGRHKESQMGAWLAHESGVVSSKAVLRAKWAEIKRKFREGQVPMPDLWGGYRVVPQTIEFWQGQPDGLHDRLVYVREEDGWEILRLVP